MSVVYETQQQQDMMTELVELIGVAVRQGIYFGVETRIPYAITSILRPILFNKPSRPFKQQVSFFADQTIAHGWIIARICIIFKLTEKALMRMENKRSPAEWHTFVAGALAGYLIMYKDNSYASMKKQINMAIGIRTLYAIASYMVRKGQVPFVEDSGPGYTLGNGIWATVMWGVVMWHWRHQTAPAPGEMNPAQVKQMNFIYNDGKLNKGWADGTHVYWLIALVAAQKALKG